MLVHVFVFHGLLALYDDPSALANRDDFGAIEIGGRYVKTTFDNSDQRVAGKQRDQTKQREEGNNGWCAFYGDCCCALYMERKLEIASIKPLC